MLTCYPAVKALPILIYFNTILGPSENISKLDIMMEQHCENVIFQDDIVQ